MYLWVDTKLVAEDALALSIYNSGLECGAGVFTTMRVHNGMVECLQEHIKRLISHATQLGLEIPEIKEEYFRQLIEKNNAFLGTFRVKVLIVPFRLQEGSWGQSRLIIYLDSYTQSSATEFKLCKRVFEPSSMVARIKTLSRLERRILWQETVQKGFDECLTTDHRGIVLEALYANIFWIHQRTLYTPDPILPYMEGIQIANIIRASHKLGFATEYVQKKFEEIPQEANLYISNALIWLYPVVAVEDKQFYRNNEHEALLLTALAEEITLHST